MPGGVQKFLDKALLTRADALILDLEDAVAPADKPAARAETRRWLDGADFGGKTVIVRMNSLETGLWEEDLEVTLGRSLPDMVMVPKASCAGDLERLTLYIYTCNT